MKILIVSNGYPSNEYPFGSIYVKNHYQRLIQVKGYDVDKHVIERMNTSLYGSVIKYIWCFIRFLPKIFKKYDIVHVHFMSPLYILALICKSINRDCKIIVTFHGSDINKLKNKNLIKIYRYMLKYNDITIAVSEELKKMADNILSINVDYVICAGFNDDIFYNQKIPVSKRKIDFLFVGSFLPIKGLDTLINSIKNINHSEIRFVFVGSGYKKNDLIPLSNKYNVEVIDGIPQQELNDIYNRAKYFILPSWNEGFNIALLEANYCGVPAIVRDIPALRTQVSDGYNGFLFTNENGLADTILACYSMSDEKWETLSINSQIKSKEYSLTNVIEFMQRIYENNI